MNRAQLAEAITSWGIGWNHTPQGDIYWRSLRDCVRYDTPKENLPAAKGSGKYKHTLRDDHVANIKIVITELKKLGYHQHAREAEALLGEESGPKVPSKAGLYQIKSNDGYGSDGTPYYAYWTGETWHYWAETKEAAMSYSGKTHFTHEPHRIVDFQLVEEEAKEWIGWSRPGASPATSGVYQVSPGRAKKEPFGWFSYWNGISWRAATSESPQQAFEYRAANWADGPQTEVRFNYASHWLPAKTAEPTKIKAEAASKPAAKPRRKALAKQRILLLIN